jgi:hypothetical protein
MRLRSFCVLGLLAAAFCFGQTNQGSISGSITDPNGAAVPGVRVQATRLETKQTFETATSDAGLYVFPDLPTGSYTVSVEKAGFKRGERSGIEIRVAQRQPLDFQLQIGDVQQTVEVQSVAPLLELTTSERGQSFSTKFMNSLPLFTGGIRNPEAFVGYMPGVNAGAEQSISGSIGRAKEVLLDGASQTIPESGGTVFNFPSAEQFGEFKLITGSYSAEYGRFGGGVEIFISKSGTNDIHGGAFLNMRRDIWDAAGWGVNSNPKNPPGFRPKERYNEAGGAMGGPVYIPHVYDGRNKTFWYFTIDKDIRPATISSVVNTLPTPLMKQGIFTEISQPLFDPYSTVGVGTTATRTPFAGNIIPRSRWSKIATNMLPAIPDTSFPGVTANYQFINQTQIDETVWSLKFDHAFSDRNRLSYYQSLDNQATYATADIAGPLGTGLGVQYQKPQNFRANHDFMFSPTVLLHTTFGFTRQQQIWFVPDQTGFASKVGFTGLTGDSDATPRINFAAVDGLTAWGMQQGKVNNGSQFNWTSQFTQGLSIVHGKHEFKTGWDIRRFRTFSAPPDQAGTNGQYVFSRAQTADPARLGTTGYSFASFLLGAVDNANATAIPVPQPQIRYQYHGFYFMDNWRVMPKLTLQLGFRYEVPIGWYANNFQYSSVDLSKPNPKADNFPGALVFPGSGPGRTGQTRFWGTDFTDIGPRLGFAYQVTPKTVLRGGWGIYYQTLGNGGCGCTLGFSGVKQVVSDGVNPAFNLDEGAVPAPVGYRAPPFVDPSYANGLNVDYMGPNFGKAPRIYTWSFTVQQEVKKFLIDVGYVGNRGHGLNSTVDLNQVNPTYLGLGSLLQKPITDPAVVAAGFSKPYPSFTGSLAQALRPYPQYLSVLSRNSGDGQIWYDSLQTKVERRFGAWQLMGAYTWSKSLSMLTYRQIFTQNQAYAQDNYNLNDMKSYLPFDQPHVFNILNSFDLPFGRGKKFLNTENRFANLALANWTLSSAQRYYSGNLIQVTAPNTLGSGVIFGNFKKANRVNGTPIQTGVDRTTLDPNNPNIRWFNAGAFSLPGTYEFGSAATYYGDFRNPAIFVENLSVQKTFGLWRSLDAERVRLQYRADVFNLFNRTNFGAINGSIGNPNFGRPQGVQQGPRVITMGLRLSF